MRWRILRIDGTGAARRTVDAQIGGQFPGTGERVPIDAPRSTSSGAVPPWLNGALLAEARWILEHQEEGALMGHPGASSSCAGRRARCDIGDESFTIDGGANRIRRQGIRRTASLWGHAWQAAIFPSGRGFAYITYPPRPGREGDATTRATCSSATASSSRRGRSIRRGCRSLAAQRPGRVASGWRRRRQATFEIRGETGGVDVHGDAQGARRWPPAPAGDLPLHVGRRGGAGDDRALDRAGAAHVKRGSTAPHRSSSAGRSVSSSRSITNG